MILALPAWIALLGTGVVGLFAGSFLNLCIFRLPRNCMSLFAGHRGCPGCSRRWSWAERIPIIGWFINLGQCPACHHSYSLRAPAVELLAGLVLILCAWRPVFAAAGELNASQRGVLFVMHAWLLGVMIVSTFINLEFGILPDELTLSGIAIAVACSWVFPFPPGARILSQNPAWVSGLATSLSGAAVGGAIPLLLGVLARLQFGREAIGLGVVKYSAFLGSALGPVDVAFAFVLASLLGVGFGRLKMALRGRLGYVQFGPFQSIAAVPLIFWSPQVHHLIEGALGLLHHRR